MISKLEWKVAIITGASAGIGEATALALAAEGTTVVLAARRSDRIQALAERIEASGGKALPIVTFVCGFSAIHQRVSSQVQSLTFNFLKLLIRFQFPNVEKITSQELAQLLLDSAKPRPLVLDARSQTEYAVSHIETAVRIDPLTPDLAALSTVSKDRPIVVYCAVGYRSAELAQQLDQAGMKCIYNLSGGIFQWANEGRLIFRDEHPTHLVHPYNRMWGKLLKASYHAQER